MRTRLVLFLLILGLGARSFSIQGQTLTTRDSRYNLRSGDVLAVEYRYSPEYNASVTVEPDGHVSLPLIGDVKVGGLSLPELHGLLVNKAGERLNDPEITVSLREFDKPHYVVGGEVGTPGRYDLHGRVTALRAVEMAGGFKQSAKASQVLLIRPIDGTMGETKVINLQKVLAKHQLNEDPDIRDGDMLIVPKNRLGKIEPYIRLVNAGFYLSPTTF